MKNAREHEYDYCLYKIMQLHSTATIVNKHFMRESSHTCNYLIGYLLMSQINFMINWYQDISVFIRNIIDSTDKIILDADDNYGNVVIFNILGNFSTHITLTNDSYCDINEFNIALQLVLFSEMGYVQRFAKYIE